MPHAVHAGLFATTSVNSAGANGAFYGRPILIVYQLADIGATAAWSVGITALILYFLKVSVLQTVVGQQTTVNEAEHSSQCKFASQYATPLTTFAFVHIPMYCRR
eukprot:Opistho-2@39421